MDCVDTIIFGQVCDACDGGAIYKILSLVIKILTGGVGVLATLGIIIAGVIYLTAAGDASRMAKAKKRISEIVIGLITYGMMFTVLQFLIPGGIIGSTLDTSTSSCPVQTQSTNSNTSNNSNNTNTQNQNNNNNNNNNSNNQNNNQATVHYEKKSNVVAKGSNGLSYILHVPEGATDNMPLVVFMHGSGETGSTKKVSELPTVVAMNNSTKYPDTNKFIAISPVQPDYKTTSGGSYDFGDKNTLTRTKALIDEVANTYKVDKSRIYIIGFSMGAAQTWCMVDQYPNYFSAAVPVSLSPKYNCAGSSPSASNFKNTDVWAMCGGSEDYAKKTQSFVNDINAAGGSAKFNTVGNYNHSQVQSNLNYSEIFSWLLAN